MARMQLVDGAMIEMTPEEEEAQRAAQADAQAVEAAHAQRREARRLAQEAVKAKAEADPGGDLALLARALGLV